MATVPRGWQLGAIAVTFGVGLPVVCGDLLVVLHVAAVWVHVVAALPQ